MLIWRWRSPFSSRFALTLVFWTARSSVSVFTFAKPSTALPSASTAAD